MRTVLLVPDRRPYPRDAVRAGLEAAGLKIVDPTASHDVVVTWSPWANTSRAMSASDGKIVLVLENGWLSPIGDQSYYQLGLWGWNGSGIYLDNDRPDRLWRWLIDLCPAPPRDPDGPILLLGQTGHSTDRRSAPPTWVNDAAAALRAQMLEVRVRLKPQAPINSQTVDELWGSMNGCSSVVSWSSNALGWAAVWGFPTVFAGPVCSTWEFSRRWPSLTSPYQPPTVDLSKHYQGLTRLSWSQWTAEELSTGEQIKNLLRL